MKVVIQMSQWWLEDWHSLILECVVTISTHFKIIWLSKTGYLLTNFSEDREISDSVIPIFIILKKCKKAMSVKAMPSGIYNSLIKLKNTCRNMVQ